jgi:hypothetical protein
MFAREHLAQRKAITTRFLGPKDIEVFGFKPQLIPFLLIYFIVYKPRSNHQKIPGFDSHEM